MMERLGVSMIKYELNKLYWTLDPDRSGELTYQEFARVFYDRRTRQAEKKRRERRSLKAPWVPSGDGLQVRRVVSEDRSGAYTSIGTPFGTLARQKRAAMREREARCLYGRWHSDRGGHHGRYLMTNRSLLNAPMPAAGAPQFAECPLPSAAATVPLLETWCVTQGLNS